jgi:hypothetical protein
VLLHKRSVDDKICLAAPPTTPNPPFAAPLNSVQLRRRDVERDQRPIPVRGQPSECLVELGIRNATRSFGRHPPPPGRYNPVRSLRCHSIGLW